MKMTHPRRNLPSELPTKVTRREYIILGGGLVINLHELRAMSKSIRQIAREAGVSRNTVADHVI